MNRFLAAIFFFWLTTSISAFAEDKVKLGFVLDLTGPAATAGVAVKNSALLAYEQLSKDAQNRIELFFEDDEFSPSKSVSAFNKLVNSNKVDVVVGLGSNTGNAVAPIADKNRIPYIAIATDPAVSKGRAYSVNLWVSPEKEVQALLPEINRRGYKRIAAITALHQFPLSVKETLVANKTKDLQIVLDEDYSPETKDFRPFLNKLKQKGQIDAIFVNLIFGQPGLFAKQAREMGLEIPLFGAETFEDPVEVTNSNGALIGQWYVNADEGEMAFVNAYNKRFPGGSLLGAANGYDAVMLINESIKRNMPINEFLHNVKDFKGALGTYSSSGDNRFSLPAAIKVVTKGGFEKLKL